MYIFEAKVGRKQLLYSKKMSFLLNLFSVSCSNKLGKIELRIFLYDFQSEHYYSNL
jgi:hypothetical protein